MALHWELGRIANWEAVTQEVADYDAPMDGIKKGDKLLRIVTQVLVRATMSVGMGRITEENHEEFFCRLRLLEQVDGARMYGPAPDHKPRFITLGEVRDHIGLSTNVSAETNAKWLKAFWATFSRDEVGRAKDRQSQAA